MSCPSPWGVPTALRRRHQWAGRNAAPRGRATRLHRGWLRRNVSTGGRGARSLPVDYARRRSKDADSGTGVRLPRLHHPPACALLPGRGMVRTTDAQRGLSKDGAADGLSPRGRGVGQHVWHPGEIARAPALRPSRLEKQPRDGPFSLDHVPALSRGAAAAALSLTGRGPTVIAEPEPPQHGSPTSDHHRPASSRGGPVLVRWATTVDPGDVRLSYSRSSQDFHSRPNCCRDHRDGCG